VASKTASTAPHYAAFDLLWLNGRNLRPSRSASGSIVAKRKADPCAAGVRWLRIKNRLYSQAEGRGNSSTLPDGDRCGATQQMPEKGVDYRSTCPHCLPLPDVSGPRVQMDSIVAHPDNRVRHIVVADEDPKVVDFVVKTLRADHHAYDALSAMQPALALPCDLVISNTKVTRVDGVDLIVDLPRRRPELPVVYLANIGRSTPEIEAQLPADVPILREPFTADELRDSGGRNA
jgi:hypothetical protein